MAIIVLIHYAIYIYHLFQGNTFLLFHSSILIHKSLYMQMKFSTCCAVLKLCSACVHTTLQRPRIEDSDDSESDQESGDQDVGKTLEKVYYGTLLEVAGRWLVCGLLILSVAIASMQCM